MDRFIFYHLAFDDGDSGRAIEGPERIHSACSPMEWAREKAQNHLEETQRSVSLYRDIGSGCFSLVCTFNPNGTVSHSE